MKATILILFLVFLIHCIHSLSFFEKKQIHTGIYIRNLNAIKHPDILKNLECLEQLEYDFIQLNLYGNSSFSVHAQDISNLIKQYKNVISISVTPTAHDDAQDMLNNVKGLLSEGVDFLWLNTEHIADNVMIINSFISTAVDIGFRLGIVHESDVDFTTFHIPIRHLHEVSLSEQLLQKCSITAERFQQLIFTEEKRDDQSSSFLEENDVVETAFNIALWEKIQWDSFPDSLGCLRKYYDTIFLVIYENSEFLGNVTNSIPEMLAHNFTLYVGIAPIVSNSSSDYDHLIEQVNSKLASYGVETNFIFYYTYYGAQYEYQLLEGIRLARVALDKKNIKMGVATNRAMWNGGYNETTLYSDLPLWNTDTYNFSNFDSYGGWTAPVANSHNYYVTECVSELLIEKQSFIPVQYKSELLKGMSVTPIANFSPTSSMTSVTPKPPITQSSSTASIYADDTTSSSLKTTQYVPKTTGSSRSSTSPAPETMETAFNIAFWEEIQWESFPESLGCLRKYYDTIFLVIYENSEFLGNVTNSIPDMLAHNFTLYVGIAPIVSNSSSDYDHLIEQVNSKLASYGVETNFIFYYTYYGAQYEYQLLEGIRLARVALDKKNIKMGVATNRAMWNGGYNETTLYSDLPLWNTDTYNFSNFDSYGGWTAPVANSHNYYVTECVSELLIEKQSFIPVQYKSELLKGMSVTPIANFSPTSSMTSVTPKPPITQSSSTASIYADDTTSSSLKTTQYVPKTTGSSRSSTSPAPETMETAFNIAFWEEIQWESFPESLGCLRKYYDTIFLVIYENSEFLGNVTNSIPEMLAHNFTLYVGIAPIVSNSSSDYDHLIEQVNSKLASYGVETNFIFYYTYYGAQYEYQLLEGIRLARVALDKKNIKMGVATNRAMWNGGYNETTLYSDLPLWNTDTYNFSNFDSYGGWTAPVANSHNYYVTECVSELLIEKQSFIPVQYKSELLKGMSVTPIANFSPTSSMTSVTPKPPITQSSSTASIYADDTTSSSLKTTQYVPKTTGSSRSSTSPAPETMETAFNIAFWEEIQWESFPESLGCLRKYYDTIFLVIYENSEFLGNVTNSIPDMLAHNFTLYVGIAPIVSNSSSDYDHLIEQVNSKLASYGVETNFIFYYTYYGAQYEYQLLEGIRLARVALDKKNIKMGVATNRAMWNGGYNETTLYSDLPLWNTDTYNFSNFDSYGGWTAPVANSHNYFVTECVSELFIEKQSFIPVQYKSELLKGMSVTPIANFSPTSSMTSVTPKPPITQSSSTASIYADDTTSSSLKTTQYVPKTTGSSPSSPSPSSPSTPIQSSTSVQNNSLTRAMETTTTVYTTTTTNKNSYLIIPNLVFIVFSIFIF